MLHVDAVIIEKTGNKGFDGKQEVIVTDKNGNKFSSYMSNEEMILCDLLKKIKNDNFRKELAYAIDEYGTEKYIEGVDEGSTNDR